MKRARKLFLSRMPFPLASFGIALVLASPLLAQEPSTATAPAEQQVTAGVAVDSTRKSPVLAASPGTESNPGVEAGPYEIRQSIELGGRIADFSGSRSMWSTLVNVDSGPRILEQTLDMHSPTHTGHFFDDLNFSNFGYGGDPNNVTRLRMLKGTLYNFNANFRRDKNFFDYNLLANPLNPANSNPSVPVFTSPHLFQTTRRMSDFSLGLFQLAPVRLKLGYSRTVREGESFSTIHQSTESLLTQPTRDTSDNYQFGIAFRFIPRTSINYDQFFTHYKGDSSWGLTGTNAILPGGIPVDLGIVFNTPANQPCGTPFQPSGLATVNCAGAFAYSRVSPIRNSYPTEQFSFQSNYFRKIDFSGRVIYSSASSDRLLYQENFNGLITRTAQRAYLMTDTLPASSRRISVTSDLGLTIHLTDNLRLVDTFRFNNFRIPSSWNFVNTSLFGATLLTTPNVFSTATCPGPGFNASTCPQHSSSSGPDVDNEQVNNFLGQDTKTNTFNVEYDFTPRITAHIGYRFERRDIVIRASQVGTQTFFPNAARRGACATVPVSALVNGVCTVSVTTTADEDTTEINAHSALLGFSARPMDALRVSFDTELFYADNTFTRISPRHLQLYRLRAIYSPKNWLNLGSTVYIRENRNNTTDVGNLQHNRSYSFTTAIAPQGKWGLDLSYDYNDIFSQTNICFVSTPSPPVAITCGAAPFLQGVSFYTEKSHFGLGSVQFRPIPRVSAGLGYAITSSVGSTLILNPNAPTGPLSFNYHLPVATLAIDLTKHFTYKTGWNYYDYNEKSAPGPTLPRDTRGNVFTLSLRYTQ